jgi:hypothetical protein
LSIRYSWGPPLYNFIKIKRNVHKPMQSIIGCTCTFVSFLKEIGNSEIIARELLQMFPK